MTNSIEQGSHFTRYVLMIMLSHDMKKAVLIEKNKGPKNLIGKLTFPGGKIESYDKSPFDAASREAFEEAGLEIAHDQWEVITDVHGSDYCMLVLGVRASIEKAHTKESEIVSIMDVAPCLEEWSSEHGLDVAKQKYASDFGVFLQMYLGMHANKRPTPSF